MGDTLSSVAVIIGGIAIWKFNIVWIDSVITVLVSFYIIYHTWGIVKNTVDILMQSVPENIDINLIQKSVENLPKVKNLHHIHIWQLDDENIHCESHINLTENINMLEMMSIKEEIENVLKNDFGINHTTLQIGYQCCENNQNLIAKK